ncbi:MarR family transcriptional regulator [Methylobacterium sp. NEAU 140]|uniref:MarR family winged helix-turn-helix transcriptional regulator n=1 Tax=Methylobacterium sp. NEAU 140 TaxID=3064945 RepID=UPI0027377B25|nr:MarR family transcriptional regulator [Methylobacterium sp. NEAU 140]MDP4023735.1 MarR family transcriptional regulator [Methylobacterium sp. NEAU 140]
MIALAQKYDALLARSGEQPRGVAEGMRTCFEVLSLAAAIDRDCAARLGEHDLSEGKFVLLVLLDEARDGLSPHELAARAGVTRGTVTGLLDGLVRSGLVRRIANAVDRRTLTVRPTASGTALTRQLVGAHGRWIGALFSDLSAADRDALRSLLAKVFARTGAGTRRAVPDDA